MSSNVVKLKLQGEADLSKIIERVDIGKLGRGNTTRVDVYFHPAEFKQFLRYSVNEGQGTWR